MFLYPCNQSESDDLHCIDHFSFLLRFCNQTTTATATTAANTTNFSSTMDTAAAASAPVNEQPFNFSPNLCIYCSALISVICPDPPPALSSGTLTNSSIFILRSAFGPQTLGQDVAATANMLEFDHIRRIVWAKLTRPMTIVERLSVMRWICNVQLGSDTARALCKAIPALALDTGVLHKDKALVWAALEQMPEAGLRIIEALRERLSSPEGAHNWSCIAGTELWHIYQDEAENSEVE